MQKRQVPQQADDERQARGPRARSGAVDHPATATPHALLGLQRSVGNHVVQRLIQHLPEDDAATAVDAQHTQGEGFGLTALDRANERADRTHRTADTVGRPGRADTVTAPLGPSAVTRAGGVPIAGRAALMLSLQRSVGNQAAQQTLRGTRAATVQRKGPSVAGVRKAVGLGDKKHRSVADTVDHQARKAKTTKVATVSDLDTQVATLESLTSKLVTAHQAGDAGSHQAALQVNAAAKRILGNLPDPQSKASKMLGLTSSGQIKRLGRVVDETQLILDEVRVQNTRQQAQNIYLAAGRSATAGQPGAFTNLGVDARRAFGTAPAAPPQNATVTAYLHKNGFASYEEAFDDALAKSASTGRRAAERELELLQLELFEYTERSRSRAAARRMGLSAAELAAIQTFTTGDYKYINPATANDPAWLAANFSDLVDKPNKTLEDWAELQDQLAAKGHTLDQREAERRQQLTPLREEGGLHTSVALEGLRKMPVWRGTAYRGERLDQRRFFARFVKDGATFRSRNPTFTWKTITSISKSEHTAQAFLLMKTGTGGAYKLLWEFEVIDGRDIEGLSVSRREREVALLPGAEFAFGPIEVLRLGKSVEDFGDIRIKAKQIK